MVYSAHDAVSLMLEANFQVSEQLLAHWSEIYSSLFLVKTHKISNEVRKKTENMLPADTDDRAVPDALSRSNPVFVQPAVRCFIN
jgi:hypothetical protein